ncbi:hypothetical protein JZO77_16675 [Enterococcus hulanensis]|uniref:hypothetical protein n=1 Tax=Enterococcus hulanensis TaxID=2559929 RepID=UPI001A8E6DA6|nr:hypothetical protein [Enterococcus hulanensis]MBO0458369.1 hypothetical protein [Enterococcus hulanensis]
MNKHRMFNSNMGSSKYEFDGDLDDDIKKRVKEAEQRKEGIRQEVFKIYQSYGCRYAEKELTDLVFGLIRKEIIVSPEGFIEMCEDDES